MRVEKENPEAGGGGEVGKEWADTIIRLAPNIIVGLGEKSKIIIFNEFAEKLTGYKAEEVIGKEWIERFIPKRMRKELYRVWDTVVKRKEMHHHHENPIITKSGEERMISWSNALLTEAGRFKMVVSIGEDVTERRKAQEEYKAIIDASIDGFWIADMQGRFLEVNDAYCRMIGYSREEMLKMRIPDIEAKEKPQETAQRIRKIMKAGGDRFESQHKRKDARIVDVEVSVNYTKEAGGRLFVFIRDITERKKAEKALEESEEKHKFLMDNIEEIVLIISKVGKILFANNKTLKTFGYSEEEIVGKSMTSFLTKNSIAKATYALAQEFLGKSQPEMEVEARTKSGETRILRVAPSSIPVYDKRKLTGIQVNCLDVTEQRKVQEELRKRNEELERINKLAVGRELRMIELKKRIEELEGKK